MSRTAAAAMPRWAAAFSGGEWAVGAGVAVDEVADGVGRRFEEGSRNSQRGRDSQGVAEPGGVFHRGEWGWPRWVMVMRLPERTGCRAVSAGRPRADGGRRCHRSAAGRASAGGPPRRRRRGRRVQGGALQPGDHRFDDRGSSNSRRSAAEELGEQAGVQRQCGGTSFGEGVVVVHERADVPEQHRRGERRRRGCFDLDHPHLARC